MNSLRPLALLGVFAYGTLGRGSGKPLIAGFAVFWYNGQGKSDEKEQVMPMKNTSDQIEAYIKSLLAESGLAEIKRSHLAETFQVVPSQINYVIKTRFTEHLGYLVESKRGGGGYIRIGRLTFSEQHELLDQLRQLAETSISEPVYGELLAYLVAEGVLTPREEALLSALATNDVLGADAANLRGKMFVSLLQRLDRKG